MRCYCPFTSSEPTLSVKDSFQLSKSPNSSSEDSHGCQSLGSDSESMTFISDGGVEDCGQGLSAMEEKAPTEKGWKEVIVATILLHPKLPPRSSLRYCRTTILCFLFVVKVNLVLSPYMFFEIQIVPYTTGWDQILPPRIELDELTKRAGVQEGCA